MLNSEVTDYTTLVFVIPEEVESYKKHWPNLIVIEVPYSSSGTTHGPQRQFAKIYSQLCAFKWCFQVDDRNSYICYINPNGECEPISFSAAFLLITSHIQRLELSLNRVALIGKYPLGVKLRRTKCNSGFGKGDQFTRRSEKEISSNIIHGPFMAINLELTHDTSFEEKTSEALDKTLLENIENPGDMGVAEDIIFNLKLQKKGLTTHKFANIRVKKSYTITNYNNDPSENNGDSDWESDSENEHNERKSKTSDGDSEDDREYNIDYGDDLSRDIYGRQASAKNRSNEDDDDSPYGNFSTEETEETNGYNNNNNSSTAYIPFDEFTNSSVNPPKSHNSNDQKHEIPQSKTDCALTLNARTRPTMVFLVARNNVITVDHLKAWFVAKRLHVDHIGVSRKQFILFFGNLSDTIYFLGFVNEDLRIHVNGTYLKVRENKM